LNIEGKITSEEVYRVIKKMKNGKAPGIDGIQAELLKSGGKEMIKRLTRVCNQVWEKREVPSDWNNNSQKGDLKDCNNWRGVTLLSIPGKVMAGIIIERLKETIDNSLRQQQSGFRKGRSRCEQIFILRQIIEKVTALNTKLLLNFIDFRKAIDCLHRPSVRSILKSYGIPERIIKIIH